MRKLASLLLVGDRTDEGTVIVECRRCGMTADFSDTPCSACGCDEIVRYSIT